MDKARRDELRGEVEQMHHNGGATFRVSVVLALLDALDAREAELAEARARIATIEREGRLESEETIARLRADLAERDAIIECQLCQGCDHNTMAENERLRADLAEHLGLLGTLGAYTCAVCGRAPHVEGHAPDCDLARLLAKHKNT